MSAFQVGAVSTVSVHYEGTVTAVDDSTVTLAGFTVPVRLGPGVRTVSLGGLDSVKAARKPARCDRDHCDDGDCDDGDCDFRDDFDGAQGPCRHGEEDALDDLGRAITTRHLDHHDGALRFCPDPVCRALDELQGTIQ